MSSNDNPLDYGMAAVRQVRLPGREDMLARLRSVIDSPHTERHFYALLLPYAGEPKTASEVVMMLALAAADYTAGMTASTAATLAMAMPAFIRVLIDDEGVRALALADYEESQRLAAGPQLAVLLVRLPGLKDRQ